MNGRVYDPKLGRFLQADPFVQDATSLQALNRYSYVENNPFAATDPSGFFLGKLWKGIKKNWRAIVAIAIMVVAPYAAAWAMGFGFSAAGVAAFGTAYGLAGTIAVGAIAGGLSGYVTTGSFKGAMMGAATGAIFGSLHGMSSGWGKIAAHGVTGGAASKLSGGKFLNGFISAGLSQGLEHYGA